MKDSGSMAAARQPQTGAEGDLAKLLSWSAQFDDRMFAELRVLQGHVARLQETQAEALRQQNAHELRLDNHGKDLDYLLRVVRDGNHGGPSLVDRVNALATQCESDRRSRDEALTRLEKIQLSLENLTRNGSDRARQTESRLDAHLEDSRKETELSTQLRWAIWIAMGSAVGSPLIAAIIAGAVYLIQTAR